jgi:single-strand DNA-binding protein
MNQIIIEGNVGRIEPLKFVGSGMAVLEFSVAVSHGKDDKKKVCWHNVTVFNRLAENVAASVRQGTCVIVGGRYEQDEWTNKEGEKRTKLKLVADSVGYSLRWDVVVPDQTEAVNKKIANEFGGGMFSDEEAF